MGDVGLTCLGRHRHVRTTPDDAPRYLDPPRDWRSPVVPRHAVPGAVPRYSPDGRWIAYVSNDSGRDEVHVRLATGEGRRITVSTEGGSEPAWAAGGREIIYRQGNSINPDDKAAQMYAERCDLLAANPPPADWLGVWVMDTK